MANFITEAMSELEHVVWPTPTENKKYMMYTIGVIIFVGAFLSLLGFIINSSLIFTRDQFPHDAIQPTVSGEDTVSQEELDKLLKDMKIETKTTPVTNETGSGATPIVTTQNNSGVTSGSGI